LGVLIMPKPPIVLPPTPPDYLAQLKSPEWKRRSAEIKAAANNKCEDCGAIWDLQVHHCQYVRGWSAADHGADLLICVCGGCHEFRQSRERAIHLAIARILRFVPPVKMERIAWRLISDSLQEAGVME
jgi:hypothetical protein